VSLAWRDEAEGGLSTTGMAMPTKLEDLMRISPAGWPGGFMVENAYHSIYRIGSRAWPVTK
jgi:hypothetical protein